MHDPKIKIKKFFPNKKKLKKNFSHSKKKKIPRPGEKERWKPWEKMDNRQLLWHGSRMTNWIGILSQGLRIAPPEAPVTGYMFGKGG